VALSDRLSRYLNTRAGGSAAAPGGVRGRSDDGTPPSHLGVGPSRTARARPARTGRPHGHGKIPPISPSHSSH